MNHQLARKEAYLSLTSCETPEVSIYCLQPLPRTELSPAGSEPSVWNSSRSFPLLATRPACSSIHSHFSSPFSRRF